MENDALYEWFDLFKQGWDSRVVENEHLLKVCFMEFLSVINKVNYSHGGKNFNTNLSSFKVQLSGTGKGVSDGYVYELLKSLGYKTKKVSSFTEAGIVGTVTTDKKQNVKVRQGALYNTDFLWIDEARGLINENNHNARLLEIINGYLDDGEIFKIMANGDVKYQSSCVFGTGTFIFKKLRLATLDTGLFQRCLFTYKKHTLKEISKINEQFGQISTKNYDDSTSITNRLTKLIKNINFEKYNISDNKKVKYYTIKFNPETPSKIGKLIIDYFDNEIYYKIKDDMLRTMLSTFLIRTQRIAQKVMCIHAVFNQKDEIDDDSIPIGFEYAKNQLDHILNFVSDTFEGISYDTEGIENYDTKVKKRTHDKMVLIGLIKTNPGISKGELRNYIRTHRNEFELGELKVYGELLKELITNKRIRIEREGNRLEYLYINNKTYTIK